MFDVGGGELLLIVLAILVLFGPKKIPEVASMVGKGMRKVRQAQDEFTQHMRDMSTELEHASDVKTSIQQLPEADVIESVSPDEDVADVIKEPVPPIAIKPAEGSVARPAEDATVKKTE